MRNCGVCGTDKGACGHQPLAFPAVDLAFNSRRAEVNRPDDQPLRYPRVNLPPHRGVAGYLGPVETYDPSTEGIPIAAIEPPVDADPLVVPETGAIVRPKRKAR